MIKTTFSTPSSSSVTRTLRSGETVTDPLWVYTEPRPVDNGKLLHRPMEVQKGDRIHALPWKWDLVELENSVNSHVRLTITSSDPSVRYPNGRVNDEYFDVTDKVSTNYGSTSIVTGITPNDISRIKSMAILKAQASLRKNVASIPMLFLERKATLKTLKKYSTFVLNNAITMQRRDVKKWLSALRRKTSKQKLKTLAKQIADSHLEFVFGVQPVLEELTSLIEHFSKEAVDVRTGRGRDRLVVEKDFISQFTKEGCTFDVVTTTRDDFSVRTDLRCSINSKVANNMSLLGFNPLYVLYDNHPLSFVIGWFSNFNTWLQSLDPLIGLEYVTGSSSIMRKRTVVRRVKLRRLAPDVNSQYTRRRTEVSVPEMTHSAVSTEFERVVHSSMPGIQALRLMDKTSLFTHAASVSLLIQRTVKGLETEVAKKPFTLKSKRRPNRYLPPINYHKVTNYDTRS